MARVHWAWRIVRFTIKILRRLNCFTAAAFDDQLLPGLPNSLVLHSILPRIPWHARPLLKATSRAWSFALDGLSDFDRHLTQISSQQHNKRIDTVLDGGDGNLVRVKHVKDCQYVISLYDQGEELWRNLPPLPCGSLPPTPMFVGFLGSREDENSIQVDYMHGKVVAASVYDAPQDECSAYVWTLDIEGGMWKWKERQSIRTKKQKGFRLRARIVDLEGKLYILRHGLWDFITPMVYDVETDEWVELPVPKFELHPKRHYYDENWVPLYTTKMRTQDIGRKSKVLYAQGPFKSYSLLDPLTMTWKEMLSR